MIQRSIGYDRYVQTLATALPVPDHGSTTRAPITPHTVIRVLLLVVLIFELESITVSECMFWLGMFLHSVFRQERPPKNGFFQWEVPTSAEEGTP